MTVRTLVLQLDDDDPPGRLTDWLIDAGAEPHVVRHGRDPLELGDHQAVVCLGGAMNANDERLADVRAFLSSCVSKGVPLLAICLGAQLLAVATGGRVEVGDKGAEAGAGLIAKRDLGWTDPLFADLPLMPDVVQFHSDVVTRLPDSAVLLAAAARYPNQAFRVGRVAYGVQFHIETSPDTVLRWAAGNPDVAASAKPGELAPARLAELHEDVEACWRPFTERFVALARGDLAPAETARPTLPMI
ncbi:type 1 glutamine amidotransferase [Actinokineospora fastidiosa]|uniref:Glutamine amidotransferase n=1 Tax=Actinokineospora fastidiosa TaxID=1816 RepID=A0A918GKR8_9PSEU|nr:type 1 glutamine amidotransferase [Actinokineospora fastidiosa]GGS44542.1 glutamine amidotransferase [Actinokineospora fastidiosa]